MTPNVSLLYSAQEFLSFISQNLIINTDFERIEKRFVLASPQDIFTISLNCKWIKLDNKGVCLITERGDKILNQLSSKFMLRLQLEDIIEKYRPSWSMKISAGRAEVRKLIPDDIEQIFREAGLYEEWNDELMECWDLLAKHVYFERAANSLRIGRKAEKLSFFYEKDRTKFSPHWQSIDSNYSGYDILSVLSNDDLRKICIEVKGTEQSINEAFFTVTRNEWQTAENKDFYKFHLWLLKGDPKLIELDSSEVFPHIPKDSGEGKWEQVRIFYKFFKKQAQCIQLNI
jgi:hypothetical protein